MATSDWFFDIDLPAHRPVMPWEKAKQTASIPTPESFDEWKDLTEKWGLWEKIEENPATGVCLYSHPNYGKRVATKDPRWNWLTLPDISESEFETLLVMDRVSSAIYNQEALPRILEHKIRADIFVDGALEYTFGFRSLEDMKTEFDSPTDWTVDGCEYYKVEGINFSRIEKGVEIYNVHCI